MNPGMYDRTISIQYPTVTNDHGSVTESWATLIESLPCWERNLSGSEPKNGDKVETVQLKTFQVPYYPGITTLMRIVRGAEIYNIEAIIEIARNEELQLQGRANG